MIKITELYDMSYLYTSNDDMSPNYDVTIKLPYYGDDEMSYVELVVKADDVDDATKKVNKYINDKKRSNNGIAWMDAYIDSIYER